MKTKFLLLLSTVILFMSIAIAAHVITTSTGTTSYTTNQSLSTLINITVSNTNVGQTSNISSVNITIPSSFTFVSGSNGTNSTNVTFVNNSNTVNWQTNTTGWYILNASEKAMFWFNITAATPGMYNITVNTTNVVNGSSTTNISVEVNDTTPTASFGTNPINTRNSSSATVIFDIKCSKDYPANVNTSQLWGNFNGTWLANTTNASVTNNSYSNITLVLADGSYTWGVFCNDTLGNSGWSTNRTLVVDTTDPTASASCSASDVRAGETVTCTCTGSDATAGVNTTTDTAVIDTTSLSGTQTYTCTVTDYAGNAVTTTTTYTISTGSPSSSGGGTTTPTWTNTHVITEEQFTNSFTKELSAKQRLEVKVNSGTHHVGVKETTSTTATIEISSDPQTATLSVGDERKFDVTKDNYYDIFVKLNSITNNKANITIKSINELITEESATKEQEKDEAAQKEKETTTPETTNKTTWTIGIIIAIIVIVAIIASSKKGKQKKKK